MRIISTVKLSHTELTEILSGYQLTPLSTPQLAKEGRIASNYAVETREAGKIIARLYPASYNEKLVSFETRALHFFASNSLSAPSPFLIDGLGYCKSKTGEYICVYPYIEGHPLEQQAIDRNIVTRAAENLRRLIDVSLTYKHQGDEPAGDLEFIKALLANFQSDNPELLSSNLANEMSAALCNPSLNEWMKHCPKGIVHADYFFENILIKKDGSFATLDFGDAYFGNPVNDICVGAMEFAVDQDEHWNLEFMREFFIPLKSLIAQFNLTGPRFTMLLQANCIRFAIYTIPVTIKEGKAVSENPYVKRFSLLNDPHFSNQIEKCLP